ncbi:hypothetical protein BDA96_02G010700 [Sorghum bicolor]|uniref:Mitochondrial import inner membrane translocase subunit TIM50 n=1 Tax=Sorghum bicolor TaxID=4558 RepID=A0A921RK77_SORBI|nr:hypothetical protein BDA96_02G010700 [Sorghum bicolor]
MERDDLKLEVTAAVPEAAAIVVAASGVDEGTLELLDEVVEKTKTMTVTDEEQATSSAAACQERRRRPVAADAAAAVNSSVDDVGAAAAADSVGNKGESANSKVPVPASLVVAQTTRKKKLLVLHLNGLLADINQDFHNAHLSNGRFRCKLVFKRPFCDDFLKFCFRNFDVGVWSSRLRVNVDAAVDILMKGSKRRLLFCWDASKCTATGLYSLENKNKPLVLKELKKLWSKEEAADGLPWQQEKFAPSNTLLLDDSPYKALRNPPHTAIFPYPYSYKNRKDDSSLAPGGDLRLYLESLATADDVPRFVREHPFGQPPITETDPDWNFYKRVLLE